MTQLQFNAECGERLIDVGIALENDSVVQALRNKDDAEIIRLLDEEF